MLQDLENKRSTLSKVIVITTRKSVLKNVCYSFDYKDLF